MLTLFVSLGGSLSGLGNFQTTGAGFNTGTMTTSLLTKLVTTFTVIAGLGFLIYFFIGAFKWITSGGDKTKLAEAQTQLTQAIIGLIVVVVAIFIVGLLGSILGIDILDPAKTLGL